MRLIIILLLICGLADCASPGTKVINGQTYKYGENFSAADANVKLGMAYLKNGDLQGAKKKLLLAQKQAPKDPATWYAMGFYQETVGDNKLASKSYRKAVKLAPKEGAVQNNYGTFLCRQGQYRQAIKHFMTAIKDKTYLETAGAYENAGLCALKIPDRKLAQQYFKLAINHDPVIIKSLFEMAQISYDQGNYKEAKKYLNRFEFFSKPKPESLWLGIRLARRIGDEETAAHDVKTLVKLFPNSPQAQQLDTFIYSPPQERARKT